MVQLAIGDNAHFALDVTDMERPPPHTTATLLPLIKGTYPNTRLWLLLGADSLRDLGEWWRPGEIIRYCRLAALARPGATLDWGPLEKMVPGVIEAVDLLKGLAFDVSSTEIRKRAGEGHTLRYLLPEPVRAYIIEQGLYGPS